MKTERKRWFCKFRSARLFILPFFPNYKIGHDTLELYSFVKFDSLEVKQNFISTGYIIETAHSKEVSF